MEHIEEKKVKKLDSCKTVRTIVSKEKADIRNLIQDNSIGKPYDLIDIVADMAMALNDLLDGKTDSEAILKYKDRQNKILGAINEKI